MTAPRPASLIKGRPGRGTVIEVTPESAGWSYLDFRVVSLGPGDEYRHSAPGRETAVTPLQGSGRVKVGGDVIDLSRSGVFEEVPQVLYAPPGRDLSIETDGEFQIGRAHV